MIKAVIVEDEGVAARKLQKMLEQEGLEVIKSLKSNQELNTFLKSGITPDLYFLDIHLNDGIIFETLQTVDIKSPIIFTTAYDEFAIRAFKQNSVDYLLKPIDKDELNEAISKFKSIYQSNNSIDLQRISQLLHAQNPSYRDRIKIKIGDRLQIIKIEDVTMVYSDSKITFVQIASGRSYPIDQSLEHIFNDLAPSKFYRVNRSQIINVDYIKNVISFSNSRLKVIIENSTQEIVVSRERVKAFKEWLG